MEINVRIGKRIKACRENAGMSQKDLALDSNLNLDYIDKIENGNDAVSVVDMKKIAQALNLSLADFFDDPLFNHG